MCREAGIFYHTGDGRVNEYNIFGSQFDNIYKKCKDTDPVLGNSMIGTVT